MKIREPFATKAVDEADAGPEDERPATVAQQSSVARSASLSTVMPVLVAISFSHLLNDTIQSLIPAIYPLLK